MEKTHITLQATIDHTLFAWISHNQARGNKVTGRIVAILEAAFDEFHISDLPPHSDLPPKTQRKQIHTAIPARTAKTLLWWAKQKQITAASLLRGLLYWASCAGIEASDWIPQARGD